MLFIDASKGFAKAGKSNKLMASDIKRIVDTVAARPQEIKKVRQACYQGGNPEKWL